jgi:release factor glutamine methyltransferase
VSSAAQPPAADVSTLLSTATQRLAAAGIPTPRVDAELLLAHVLDVPRTRLLATARPGPDAVTAYEAAVGRRATREPLQHIVGTTPFRHVEVGVGPGVFIPRPETELLVDAALPSLTAARAPIAVDLCSGSGALALALADEVPAARVVAVELPGAGAEWLSRNAAGTVIEVVAADVAEVDLLAELRGKVDAVVSNPPYVLAGSYIAPEVRHDPAVAVFAGPDGLSVIRHVVARAAELLRPGGVFAMEHENTHREAVPELLIADGRWRDVVDHDDLAGHARYVTAVRGTAA